MSGRPWGRTGRVTLNALHPGFLTEVFVDDELVGHVYDDDLYAWDRHRWKFSPPMPTADHALWWLLRRAAPDVWRAERPVVWRVLPPAGACRNLGHWRVTSVTGSSPTFCLHGHARALAAADPSRAHRSRVARPMTPLPRGLRRLATFRIRPPRVRPSRFLLTRKRNR